MNKIQKLLQDIAGLVLTQFLPYRVHSGYFLETGWYDIYSERTFTEKKGKSIAREIISNPELTKSYLKPDLILPEYEPDKAYKRNDFLRTTRMQSDNICSCVICNIL